MMGRAGCPGYWNSATIAGGPPCGQIRSGLPRQGQPLHGQGLHGRLMRKRKPPPGRPCRWLPAQAANGVNASVVSVGTSFEFGFLGS